MATIIGDRTLLNGTLGELYFQYYTANRKISQEESERFRAEASCINKHEEMIFNYFKALGSLNGVSDRLEPEDKKVLSQTLPKLEFLLETDTDVLAANVMR